MNLERIECFRASAQVIDDTETTIVRAGRDGFEVFVLWSGVVEDAVFRVVTAHVPRQTSYQLDEGLCVRIGGDELHRLNVRLFETEEILGVQVHSHPKEAYHSDTDDMYPVVTLIGGLSIVVPRFGREGLIGPNTAMYRLEKDGWTELEQASAACIVEVVS